MSGDLAPSRVLFEGAAEHVKGGLQIVGHVVVTVSVLRFDSLVASADRVLEVPLTRIAGLKACRIVSLVSNGSGDRRERDLSPLPGR